MLPVISVLYPEILNLSPLRGYNYVVYVSSSEDLLDSLNNIKKPNNEIKLLNLDNNLAKWNEIIYS